MTIHVTIIDNIIQYRTICYKKLKLYWQYDKRDNLLTNFTQFSTPLLLKMSVLLYCQYSFNTGIWIVYKSCTIRTGIVWACYLNCFGLSPELCFGLLPELLCVTVGFECRFEWRRGGPPIFARHAHCCLYGRHWKPSTGNYGCRWPSDAPSPGDAVGPWLPHVVEGRGWKSAAGAG